MATLVLTAVGTAIAGPVGGALGGMIGQAVDTQLFGPGPRRGPRLDDLKLQTSSYGTQIPRLYGRMRAAGTVVWATDLQESENIEGGGKGSPEVVQYSYSCSFAVALSSRPIVGIGRIWADGKLIRGRSGDFKVKTRFRLHRGDEGQSADPLISSIEGTSKTPAYRGLALAVFEDLALGEFGNRIPMLTFEVVADEEPVGVASLIGDASGNIIVTGRDSAPSITGFAALGSDRRAAIEPLAELTSTRFRVRGDKIEVATAEPARPVAIAEPLGWGEIGKAGPSRGEWSQDSAGTLPASLSIRYHEPARDYQAGTMRATMPGGRGDVAMDSAAAMSAAMAKEFAESAMARRAAGRDRLTLRLSPDWIDLVPGDQLDLGWRAGRWTVEEVLIDSFAVVAECRRTSESGGEFVADPGRASEQPDEPIGQSVVALFDLPDSGGASAGLRLHAAVSANGGFKAVPLTSRVGEVDGPVTVASRRARLGCLREALAGGAADVIDARSSVEVALVDPTQILLNADDDALDSGANLCMIGDELLQFGRAADLGGGIFRLSRLVRGRRGSEWAARNGHAVGEPFVMVDRSTLVPISADFTHLGHAMTVTAHGVADGDNAPPATSRTLAGVGLAPLSPCHPELDVGDEVILRWTGRSRERRGWVDGISDAAIAARFEVVATGPYGSVRVEVDGPMAVIDAGQRSLLGDGLVRIEIREVGALRLSPPCVATFNNQGI